MTNQQLKSHCEDVIANPQDHLYWVVDMARVALASLEAVPSTSVKNNGCKHKYEPNGYGYGFKNFKCSSCGKTKTERMECPE